MSLNPHISRIRRELSHEITPITGIGRKNFILSTQQGPLRRTMYDSVGSYFSPPPIIHKMASGSGSGGTGGASTSQPSASSVIGSLYSHQIPIQ